MMINLPLGDVGALLRRPARRPPRSSLTTRPAVAMCLPQRASGAGPGQRTQQEFIARPGRNFRAIYRHPNARRQRGETAGSNI